MKKFGLILSLAFAVLVVPGFAQRAVPAPTTPTLMAHGQQMARHYGNRVWPRFSQTPFPALLLEAEGERFFCPYSKPEGFIFSGADVVTGCRVYYRAANHFAKETQVTLMFSGSEPVVVMGTPELSESNVAAWMATLLHEHFHQYQMNWSGYKKAIARLSLENTGAGKNWRLQYPFAYDDVKTGNLLALLSSQLAEILMQPDRDVAKKMIIRYARLRPLVFGQLAEGQRRYLEFQLWQEGVARYTELAMVEFAASDTTAIWMLQIDFAALGANLRKNMIEHLLDSGLSQHQRAYFYSFGAAEALVLDMMDINWRDRYFEHPASLSAFFQEIAAYPT